MPSRQATDLLPLSPAMFHVLVCLAAGERHGYRILKEVAARTDGAVTLSTGTLYGIMKRLLDEGLAVEVPSADDRRRAYRLTPFGRDVARAEADRLESLVASARAARLLPSKARGSA